MTLEGWSDIMYDTMAGVSPYASIYFVLLVLFGAFYVINLFLAVLWHTYLTTADARGNRGAAPTVLAARNSRDMDMDVDGYDDDDSVDPRDGADAGAAGAAAGNGDGGASVPLLADGAVAANGRSDDVRHANEGQCGSAADAKAKGSAAVGAPAKGSAAASATAGTLARGAGENEGASGGGRGGKRSAEYVERWAAARNSRTSFDLAEDILTSWTKGRYGGGSGAGKTVAAAADPEAGLRASRVSMGRPRARSPCDRMLDSMLFRFLVICLVIANTGVMMLERHPMPPDRRILVDQVRAPMAEPSGPAPACACPRM